MTAPRAACARPSHVLVVGYGSIGQRHAAVLTGLGCSVAVLSRRPLGLALGFTDLAQALSAHRPCYVVVANETAEHGATMAALAAADFAGTVLVEKPLFSRAREVPAHRFAKAYVAYNLRFHPLLLHMRALLAEDKIVCVDVHVGQYLPDWRPGTDYRQSYSASVERGGGVLRDLSHELDYICWILGGWQAVAALGGQLSDLEISSDDVCSLLLQTPRCAAVSVHMNYLDRSARRTIIVNTGRGTLVADLIGGTLSYLGQSVQFATERNTTYQAMHSALLAGDASVACTLPQAMATMELIDGAQRAVANMEWVKR